MGDGGAAKPKALRLGIINHAHETWNALSAVAELVEPLATNRHEFIQECKSGRLDGVVAAFRTFGSASITGPIDEDLVAALPKSLSFLAHNGAGYDQIDVAACTARDPPIRVSNVPTAVDDATADTAMFLLLGALRNFSPGMQALRRGEWLGRGGAKPALGHDPQGKTLGIVGMGGIGRNLKRKAEAFGMRVIYHNRGRLAPELEAGATYVGFEELLARADVVSLNLPLNEGTRHTISKREFGLMKDGVVVVNTARGAVMDEDALVQALESGKVYSCGLDVYENEPEVHPKLAANDRALLVPHMGTYSQETQLAMEEWCIDNVRMALVTGKLKSPVREQAGME